MPPGDRQRSVRSDRSVMLGVLCTVCYSRLRRVFHAMQHTGRAAPRRAPRRAANFRKAPRGVTPASVPQYRTALSRGSVEPRNARERGTDSRNVVYDFHHARLASAPFSIPFDAVASRRVQHGGGEDREIIRSECSR